MVRSRKSGFCGSLECFTSSLKPFAFDREGMETSGPAMHRIPSGDSSTLNKLKELNLFKQKHPNTYT